MNNLSTILRRFEFNSRAFYSPVAMRPAFRPDCFVNRPRTQYGFVHEKDTYGNVCGRYQESRAPDRRPFVCMIGGR